MTAAIEIRDLRKRYGPLNVLDGLTLTVEEGEVYGLLGPNGAGKTTLIHTLMGFLHPTSGTVLILGRKPAKNSGRIGYLPERVRYHGHFSPREYLLTLASFHNFDRAEARQRTTEVLELVGLTGAAERRIGTFSKGMLQRLGIAQALLHEPALLLIDEPTSGLDPIGQREMLDLLTELRGRGHTILMCSHYLAEVEELCQRVGVLHGGTLVAEARMADLVNDGAVSITVGTSELSDAAIYGLRALGPGIEVRGREVLVSGGEALERRVMRVLIDSEVPVAGVRRSGGLSDLYRRATSGQSSAAQVDAAQTIQQEEGLL